MYRLGKLVSKYINYVGELTDATLDSIVPASLNTNVGLWHWGTHIYNLQTHAVKHTLRLVDELVENPPKPAKKTVPVVISTRDAVNDNDRVSRRMYPTPTTINIRVDSTILDKSIPHLSSAIRKNTSRVNTSIISNIARDIPNPVYRKPTPRVLTLPRVTIPTPIPTRREVVVRPRVTEPSPIATQPSPPETVKTTPPPVSNSSVRSINDAVSIIDKSISERNREVDNALSSSSTGKMVITAQVRTIPEVITITPEGKVEVKPPKSIPPEKPAEKAKIVVERVTPKVVKEVVHNIGEGVTNMVENVLPAVAEHSNTAPLKLKDILNISRRFNSIGRNTYRIRRIAGNVERKIPVVRFNSLYGPVYISPIDGTVWYTKEDYINHHEYWYGGVY